jgi:hypothetical protein
MNKLIPHTTLAVILLSTQMVTGCGYLNKKTYPDDCSAEEPLCTLDYPSEQDGRSIAVGLTQEDVRVCGCKPWNSSGITVRKNQRYEITLNDEMNWKDGVVPSNPVEGWEGTFYKGLGWLIQWSKRSNQTDWYVVTGSVGNDDRCTFPVLSESSDVNVVTIPKDGTLYFFANDMYGRYFNNHGYAMLGIKRIGDASGGAVPCGGADEIRR